jgi:hypothetical protein
MDHDMMSHSIKFTPRSYAGFQPRFFGKCRTLGRKATRRTHKRKDEADLVIPRPGRRVRHLEGDADGLEKTVLRKSAKAIPLLVDQDLTMTMIETPRGWGVRCPHASRRGPP